MNPTTLHSLRRMARIVIAAMLTFSVSDALAVPAVAPVLTPFSPETNGVVSGEVNRQLAFTGTATSFAATGLPRGVTLNTRTGLITGRPLVSGNFTLIFTAWNGSAKSAPLTVYWTVEPLPAGTAGSYNALLDRQDWLNGGYGGSLRLTVNADGTYSGVINRGYHSNRIVGQLETQPGGVAPIGEFSVPRRSPYVPLQFAFVLPIGTGQISGVLSEPEGFSANLSGFRAAYSASRPATTFAGRWNTGYELPVGLVGNATFPQGASWATQTITAAGAVNWSGRLADGTAFTYSTGLAEGGQTALHVMLYNFNGSIQGWQTLNSTNGYSSASLGWVKAAVSGRSYAAGFPQHSLTGIGGKYTPPSPGSLIFGISPGSDNARFNFTQGGLAAPYTQFLTVGAGNKITFPAGGGNPYKLTTSMDVNTGILTGSGTALDFSEFTPNNARAGTISALLIPNIEKAVGHFLLPTSRSATAPILSGKLVGEEVTYFN